MMKEFHKILKEGRMDSRQSWFNVEEYKKIVNEAEVMKTTLPKETPKAMKKLMEWYESHYLK